jgi:type VI secretion system secreted protein VgrG
VFNAVEQVPYKLPQYKSRSAWKSNSYPGGGGFNELTFEDAKEAELVYVQAQKDLRKLVKNDETITVGGNRQALVKGDELEETRGNRQVLIGAGEDVIVRAARKELVGADSDLHVKGDRVVRVGGDDALVVGGQVHVKAGAAIVVEGPDLTLKGPGGFIRIDATGVTIVGTVVNINSGGSPGTATGRTGVEAPAEAKPEDVSTTGIGR